jgi:nickel-dependent lactate racemase
VPSQDEAVLIQRALAGPVGSGSLSQRVGPGQRVVVVTSDVTRPCPSARLLPYVLDELNRGGVPDEDITVVFGLGAHRSHTLEEQRRLVGDTVYQRVRCIDSDPTDVQFVGRTSRGTPVSVFRPVLEADARVCLGGIEYHYFAGYSGGVKAIVPGVCAVETIQSNHRMMTEPGAAAGRLDGNPVREDIEEAGQMVGVDFILNVILDGSQRIADAVAGHPQAAHRMGCARLEAAGRAVVERPVDLVIVSAGGYPKDINLYQAQKALDNVRGIVRPGGIILLVAECSEGLGNPIFEAWMQDPGGPDAIIARIRREFILGGHKAAAIAMIMKQAAIFLVSDLPPHLVRAMGFQPFDSPDAAFRSALGQLGPAASVGVIPEGAATLPRVSHRR